MASSQTNQDSCFDMTINELFEIQAEKTPKNTALIFKNSKLSYRELNESANRLARAIRKHYHTLYLKDIEPDTLIGICMNRGLNMIIAMLGILKAGCAYIPLDPSYPRDRLRFMMNDTNAPIVVTEHILLEKLLFLNEGDFGVISLDGGWDFISRFPGETPSRINKSRNLAYVIYTSGSTGKPKGVMIEHIGIVNLSENDRKVRKFDHNTRMLQFSSINFDSATAEIYPTLTSGGTLHIAEDNIRKNPALLINYIKTRSITDISLTPAILKLMPREELPSLKSLLIGGDICDRDTMDFWSRNRLFINAYGPTECSVCATECIYDSNRLHNEIGFPINNVKVYILDGNMKPVCPGEAGELYIGGVGVSRGYLNRPDLNETRFIENPFSSDEDKASSINNRLYKSGDLARLLNDGSHEFLGRLDLQVKINGFRIEPEEIETVLSSHSRITDCAVIPYGDESNKRLAAYYIPAKNASLSLKTLRSHLLMHLPEYMIPSVFIETDSLPLSPEGKVDRKNLPLPTEEKIKSMIMPSDSFRKSRISWKPGLSYNETENTLINIWKDLLKIDKININDNFYEIGGNSILTVRMLSRVKSTLNTDIDLINMFTKPTISALASYIDGKEQASSIEEDNLTIALNDAKTYISIVNSEESQQFKNENILITGITGFLGVHILDELISKTEANIHCIVIGKNDAEIKNKISNNFIYYGKEYLINNPRINIIKWNLEKNLIEIGTEIIQSLENTIDNIYHCGALVHHIYDYGRLKSLNVKATVDLIKIAARGKKKKFNFISTLGAACIKDNEGKNCEIVASNMPTTRNGYMLSKWVCERILAREAENGMEINIFRPGNITGNSNDGKCNPEKNHALLLLKGCIEMKAAPDWKRSVEMTPVDILSNAIFHLSQNSSGYNIFNMNNPVEINWVDYISFFLKKGFRMELLPLEKWREKYLDTITEENAMFSLKEFYLKARNDLIHAEYVPFYRWNSKEVQQKLKEAGIKYPDNYDDHLNITTEFLIKSGFLNI